MENLKKNRKFERADIRCVLDSFHINKDITFDEIIEQFFYETAPTYYSLAKEMNFNDHSDSDIPITLKSKFYTLIFSMFPQVYKKKTRVTISEKGISFRSKVHYQNDANLYLMLIFEGEILPFIINGNIVRIVPYKEKEIYQYVVNFIDLEFIILNKIKNLFKNTMEQYY